MMSFASDSLWSYAPTADWTAWSGPGPIDGTLHYAKSAGAVATLGSPPDGFAGNVTAIQLVLKVGERGTIEPRL